MATKRILRRAKCKIDRKMGFADRKEVGPGFGLE